MFDTVQPEISFIDTVIPEIRGDLRNIRNIADLLACFGFQLTDAIDRRKLVQINRLGREALSANVVDLVKKGLYEESKEQRKILEQVGRDIDSLQCQNMTQTQGFQRSKYQNGSKEFLSQVRCSTASKEAQQRNENAVEADELAKKHAIERENLLKRMDSTPVRSTKFSKRSLELQQAERCLARLNQFDDAANVRRMRQRQEKEELQLLCNEMKCKEDSIWRNLDVKQHNDQARLEEKSVSKLWRTKRTNETKLAISTRMLSNCKEDMNHTMHQEVNAIKRNAEMTTEVPSLLLQHRRNYDGYSSANRGDQILAKCRSSQASNQDKVVYVESVVKSHDFQSMGEGTTLY